MKRGSLLMLGALTLCCLAVPAFAQDQPVSTAPEQLPMMPGSGDASAVPVPGTVVASEGALTGMLDSMCQGGGGCQGSFVAGGGFYLIQPRFHTNQAYNATTGTTSGSTTTTTSQDNTFNYDVEIAPRWWVGYVNDCGFGVRMRNWMYQQGSQQSFTNSSTTTTITSADPLNVGDGGIQAAPQAGQSDHFFFNSDLRLSVWDWEVIQSCQLPNWALLFSGGVRYAHIAQDYNAYRVGSGGHVAAVPVSPSGPGTITSDLDVLTSGHSFDGVGLTFASEARRPLCNTGFSIYGSARVSLLYGRSIQRANMNSVLSGTFDAGGPFNSTLVDSATTGGRDDLLPIGELELGIDWTKECGKCMVFVQTGFVSQVWFNAGSAASLDGDLGLIGLTVTGGVHF